VDAVEANAQFRRGVADVDRVTAEGLDHHVEVETRRWRG
jgi:hypothetical protein